MSTQSPDSKSFHSYLEEVLPAAVIPEIPKFYTVGEAHHHQDGVDIYSYCELGTLVIAQVIICKRLEGGSYLRTYLPTDIVFEQNAPGMNERSLTPDELSDAIDHLETGADIVATLVASGMYFEQPKHEVITVESTTLRHSPGESAHALVGDIDG